MRRAVLLDLGGVLVELGGEQAFTDLLGGGLTREQMWHRWLHSPAVRAHETGRMDAKDFAAAAVREFGLSLSPAEFLERFSSWIVGPFEGAHALLDELAERHDTAILTNISGAHWDLASSYGLFERVGRVIASHQIGEIKPDPAFFEVALASLGADAGRAVFFDDNALNVESARRLGIESHLVRGLDETRRTLEKLGLLGG